MSSIKASDGKKSRILCSLLVRCSTKGKHPDIRRLAADIAYSEWSNRNLYQVYELGPQVGHLWACSAEQGMPWCRAVRRRVRNETWEAQGGISAVSGQVSASLLMENSSRYSFLDVSITNIVLAKTYVSYRTGMLLRFGCKMSCTALCLWTLGPHLVTEFWEALVAVWGWVN